MFNLPTPLISGCSVARSSRLLWEQEVAGSNPATPTFLINTFFGMWRSLVAHTHGVRGVAGSNPVIPTNKSKRLYSSIVNHRIFNAFYIPPLHVFQLHRIFKKGNLDQNHHRYELYISIPYGSIQLKYISLKSCKAFNSVVFLISKRILLNFKKC